MSADVAPWCAVYVVMVLPYIVANLVSRHLLRHNPGVLGCTVPTVDWGSDLAILVQSLWVIMSARPFVHACMFFWEKADDGNVEETALLVNASDNTRTAPPIEPRDDETVSLAKEATSDYEDDNAHKYVQTVSTSRTAGIP